MLRANNLFVDTAGWGDYLDRSSSKHLMAVRLIQQAALRRRRLVTTNYIFYELVALLSSDRFHFPRQQVITAINSIKGNDLVEVLHIDQATDDEAWQLLENRLDKEWSLVDASSFIIMKRYRIIEALTSDHHFEQAGFTKLL